MRVVMIAVAAIALAFSAVGAPAQTGGAIGTSGGAAAKSGSDATAPAAAEAKGGGEIHYDQKEKEEARLRDDTAAYFDATRGWNAAVTCDGPHEGTCRRYNEAKI